MKLLYQSSPIVRDNDSTAKIMFHLTLCLLVIFGFSIYYYSTIDINYAFRVVMLMLNAVLTSIVVELLWAKFYLKTNPFKFVYNSFPWVTAIIIVLICPIAISHYAITIGTISAILIGKLLFGGFGKNLFNPAAVGRAVIFATFMGSLASDVVTGATPTTTLDGYGWIISSPEIYATFMTSFGGLSNLFIGMYPGAIGETSTLLIILCGIYLVWKDVIDWRIPVFYIGGVFVFSSMIALTHSMGIWYPLASICTGGVAFGAVFMATDPVTNPTSNPGRIIFAIGMAFITILIRFVGVYPEGVLFSILIMNMLTPYIERATNGKQFEIVKHNLYIIAVLIIISCSLVFGVAVNAKPVEPTEATSESTSETDTSATGKTDTETTTTGEVEGSNDSESQATTEDGDGCVLPSEDEAGC